LLLGKKSRQSGRILGVAEIAQADANQAKPLVRTEADAFPQRQGDIRQFLARSRWRTWRVAARENLEFAGLQFQYDGASDSRFFPRCGPCVLRKSSNHRFRLGQQEILFEGVFSGYGLCWPVRYYLAVVDSPSQLVETRAIAAEAAFQRRQIHPSKVGDRSHLKVVQLFFRDFAYSG
jgi:hypothetical protein